MQIQAYEGYWENGKFFPIGNVSSTPERKKAILTVLDELVTVDYKQLPYGRGCMKGKMWIADDFNAPLEDFREYME